MRQFTTPTVTLTIEGIDLTAYNVYVTFQQDKCDVLTLEADTISYGDGNTTILVPLTQQQTGSFSVGKARVQVNWTDGNGNRNVTKIGTIDVEPNLLAQVIDDA